MPDNLLPVDVICDLRQSDASANDIGTVQRIWDKVCDALIGRPLARGQSLDVPLSESTIRLWVVDAHSLGSVSAATPFNIVDVLRNPTLLYRCRVCGSYGPLRCSQCESEKRPERLCAKCAHFIKDELSAYCPDHIPHCNCHDGCNRPATFRCSRCHRLFGEHVRRQNPRNPEADYCQRCHQLLFEQCTVCAAQGRSNLGKSKCAFRTRSAEHTCGSPLCWDHSFQWKIWGPHNRGVTLCAQHRQLLSTSEPADLLFMMLTARPPYAQRGRRQSLPNPFRLRRIMNRNRAAPLTFEQIGVALRSLAGQVDSWGEPAKRNYEYLLRSFNEGVGGLSQVEAELLAQVRAFYQRTASWEAADRIISLEIADRFFRPGQPPRYRVIVRLSTTDKRPYLGPGYGRINDLSKQLNIEVDLRGASA